jgi:uncharacterized lipoprotein YmbA
MTTLSLARPGLLALVCGFLCACAVNAPEVTHLQLAIPAQDIPTRSRPAVYVDAVTIPDYLLRSELLLRDNDYSFFYDASQRWAEPLDLALRRVVTQRLKEELGSSAVSAFPAPLLADTEWRLSIDVQRFEAAGMQAVLEATGHWRAAAADDHREFRVTFRESLPLDSRQGRSVAAALSDLATRFARALADTIEKS